MNKLIIRILCILSLNAFADCPQFQIKVNSKIEKVGILPNGKSIYQVLSKNPISQTECLSILTTCTTSLPTNINFCSEGQHDLFYVDNSLKALTQKEMDSLGIISILPFSDASIKVSSSFKGQWLLIQIKHYDIYGRGDFSEYRTYSWNMLAKKYKLIEKKEVSNVALELFEIQYKIELQDIEQLYVLLSEFNYGGGYGSRLYRFPKEFSKDLWSLIHNKSLLLYNSGKKIEAAQLVSNLLEIVKVQLPKELEDQYIGNFAIDALHQNEKLIPQISDCAFFLERANLSIDEAISIFRYILKISPDRVNTYLNLANALWKKNKKERAIIEYKKYISLIKYNNNESEIPDYVLKRTLIKNKQN